MISNGTVKSIGPRLVCSFLLVLVVALTGSHVALADTQSSLSQAKTQAATLEAQLKDLEDQAAALRDTYDSANTQLARTETDAAQNADLLAQAQEDQLSAEAALSARLAEIYKQGPGSTLAIILTSSSWSSLLDRVSLVERISKQDADLLTQVKSYRAQVADEAQQLTAQLEKQQTDASDADAARQAMDQKLAQAQQQLSGKQTEVAKLLTDWQNQQQAQALLDQQRQAKLDAALAAAQAAAQSAGQTTDGGSGGNSGGGGTSTSTTHTTTNHTTSTTTPKSTTSTTKPKSTTSTTSGNSTHHSGVSNILKPEQIALAAQNAGFSGDNLVIAVAVAMSESGCDANAIGRLKTYGLWQILASAHPNMIDPSNPDASRWFDAYVNAGFAWRISSHGTNWVPWSVYTSGSYQKNMARARTAVSVLLSNPDSITPPGVK